MFSTIMQFKVSDVSNEHDSVAQRLADVNVQHSMIKLSEIP